MKNYYINYYRNFANEYGLCWIDSADTKSVEEAVERGWERITRKEAFRKVSEENYRLSTDYSFSGFASTVIIPYSVFYDGPFERMDRYEGVIYSCDLSNKKRLVSGDGVIFE